MVETKILVNQSHNKIKRKNNKLKNKTKVFPKMLNVKDQVQVACLRTLKKMIKQVKGLKDNNPVIKSEQETPTDKKLMGVNKMTKVEIVM